MSVAATGPGTAAAPALTRLDEIRQSEREQIVGWVRSPSDVLRVLVYGVVALLLVALAQWAETATSWNPGTGAGRGPARPFSNAVMPT